MNALDFADELGPFKIVQVRVPRLDLQGALVVDNVAAGPAIGGLRMAPDVTVQECARLARAMTLKNAAAGLPHGGGKSVLVGDPRMPRERKEPLIRAFASALRDAGEYIFGPDMGTDESCMAWIRDEIGRAVGLPREFGGIPLDEIGATGWGLLHAAEAAQAAGGVALKGARIAVQGFGAVGMHAARFLTRAGAVLVAAADSRATIADPGGLDVDALIALKERGASVGDHARGERLAADAVIDADCEIWIPAARPDVIDRRNVGRLRAKIVLEGANIPVTPDAEEELHRKGVLCVPDFIANAGGVICAALEYHGASESAALQSVAERIRRNSDEVLARMKKDGVTPRRAAVDTAVARVKKAMDRRRGSLFSAAPGFV